MNRKWCAVYLLLDEECLDRNEFFILGYFTLSHKFLIPHDITKSQIKKITGGIASETLHFVLIGQLGKFIDEAGCSYISGEEILSYAFEIIDEASELIPCRCVLVECSEKPKLQNFYKQNGFKFLQQDETLFQFYKAI